MGVITAGIANSLVGSGVTISTDGEGLGGVAITGMGEEVTITIGGGVLVEVELGVLVDGTGEGVAVVVGVGAVVEVGVFVGMVGLAVGVSVGVGEFVAVGVYVGVLVGDGVKGGGITMGTFSKLDML